MKIITINLPPSYLDAIQVLNDLGIYNSRSEAIRVALKDFLKDELELYEDLEKENFEKLIKSATTPKKEAFKLTKLPVSPSVLNSITTTKPKPNPITINEEAILPLK